MTPYKLLTALSVRNAITSWVKDKTLQEAWAECEHGPAMLLFCTAMCGAGYEGWPSCADLVGVYLQILKLVGLPRAGRYKRMCTDVFHFHWEQHLLGEDFPVEKAWNRISKSRFHLQTRGKRKLTSSEHILRATSTLMFLLGESTVVPEMNEFWYQSELFLDHVFAACQKDKAAICELIANLCRSNLGVPDLSKFANSRAGQLESLSEQNVHGHTILLGRCAR
jgi:hypothetical protein